MVIAAGLDPAAVMLMEGQGGCVAFVDRCRLCADGRSCSFEVLWRVQIDQPTMLALKAGSLGPGTRYLNEVCVISWIFLCVVYEYRFWTCMCVAVARAPGPPRGRVCAVASGNARAPARCGCPDP